MTNVRERAITVAKDILQGNVDAIDGCCELARLRHDLDMSSDSSFLVFAAIDSDTDEWPSSTARRHYSKDALTKINTKIQGYFEQVKPEMLKACQEIIEKLDLKG